MKKYLMTAATALVLGGLMTSCTKDLDSGGSVSLSQNAKENYKEAFVSTFGMPVEGLDWGFGPGTNAAIASTRAAMTRTFDDRPAQPTFRGNPGIPTTYQNTLEDAKNNAGAKPISDGIQNNGVYYMTPGMNAPDTQNTPLTIYFDGDFSNNPFGGNNYQNGNGTTYCVTSNSKLKLSNARNNLKIYLAPNAELDLSGINWDLSLQDGGGTNAIYISSGSTLKLYSLNFFHGTIINEGTITASNLKITDGALLYNNGTVDVRNGDGWIQIYNTDGEIVNNGELKGKKMTLNAGAKFFNTVNGETTISGPVNIENIQDSWMNSGTFTCNSFSVDAKAEKLYNNCRMTVNGNFHMCEADSRFVLQGDAALVCESFTWRQCRFYMGSKSLLWVKGDLLSENQNSGGFGFHGPSGNNPYAVIKAKAIKWNSDDQYRMAYFGNLYIDAESHSKQGAKDPMNNPPVQPYYYHDSSVKFSFTDENDTFTATTSPVSIEPSDCSPGYNSDVTPPDPPTPPVTPTTDKVRVIAEDLSMNDGKPDFDFNDVVFDVDLLSNNKVRITLLAAGGTLPLTVGDPTADLQSPTMEMQYDSQGAEMGEVMTYEVHHQFKVATTTMVNTNAAGGANRDAVEIIIDNPSSSSDIHEIANTIPIRVFKGGEWIELEKAVPVGTRTEQLTASKVAVDGTFQWCAERISITKDTRYQYASYKGNQKSRFELYLEGKLSTGWWKSTSVATE